MKEFISSCFFAFIGLLSTAQSALPGLKHFGPEHGLPSAECHDLLSDEMGLLWVATDNGICSFDGLHFRAYGTNEGLSDPVVLHLATNARGEILCLSLNYRLFVFRSGRFSPHPREFILRNKVVPGDIPQGMLIGEDGYIYIATSRSGLICIDCPDEEITGDPAELYLYCGVDEYIAAGSISNPEGFEAGTIRLLPEASQLRTSESFAGKLPLRTLNKGNELLLSAGNLLILIRDNRSAEVLRPVPGKIQALQNDGNGRIWIGSSEGLHVFAEGVFDGNPPANNLLSGVSVSCLLPTPDSGSLWVASAGQGIFFLPHFSAGRFEDLSTHFRSLETDAEGNLYLLDEKGILRMQKISDPLLQPDVVATNILAICSSEEGEVLALSTRPASGTRMLKILSNEVLESSGVIGASHNAVTGEVMVHGRRGFLILSEENGKLLYSSSQHQFYERCYDIRRDNNRRLWVATPSGIYIKNQDGFSAAWPEQEDKNPAVVTDLELMADRSLLFLEKGKGIVQENGARLNVNPAYHGISAATYRKMRMDREGNLLLIGPSGVAQYALSGDTLSILTFTDASDGLASGEIRDACITNGKLAVLTRHGLSLLPGVSGVRDVGKPFFTATLQSDTLLREFQESGLVGPFIITCPEFLRPQSLRFRFRVNPDSPWMESASSEIAFPGLPGGDYRLEVAASLAPGQWSQSVMLPFRVRLPYWKTWWFFLLCTGVVVIGAYFFLRYTLRRLRKSHIIEKKLIHLERSALLAQMNPHFIFNSLNSIQSYIALNENDKANRFLAKFARLIRAMLNHSRAQKITLHEEIDSLRLYLELEKMRFKDKFEFEITVDKDIDTTEVELPPLLIQPYLENAIIHGLARKEGIGRVELLYLKIGQYLIATVTDNGIGLEAAKKMKDKPDSLHKSVGMTITQKRLELLDEGSNDKKVTIEEVKDRFGKVLGTKVEVKIRL